MPVSAVAGQAFTNQVVATFTDSDPNANPADFTATIDWGDGIKTPSTTVTAAGPGTFNVLGTTLTSPPAITPSASRSPTVGAEKVTANGTASVA